MNVIYETVTNEIIAELEAGAIPWTKPWKSSGKSIGIMPTNAVTGRSYSGINIPILWHSASSCGYDRHAWLTYRQAQEKGAQVRNPRRN
jgi:antirestriction protein ArdC